MVFNLDDLKGKIIDDDFKRENSEIEPNESSIFEKIYHRHCGKPMVKAKEYMCGVERNIFYCQKCGDYVYA